MKKTKGFFLVLATLMVFVSCGEDSKDSAKWPQSVYSEQPHIGVYQDYAVGNQGQAGIDAIVNVNPNCSVKTIITIDGLQFKDSNGDGELQPYEDWRLSPEERAANLVSLMPVERKIPLLIHAGGPGNPTGTDSTVINGLADDGTVDETSNPHPFGYDVYRTAYYLVNYGVRYGLRNGYGYDTAVYYNNVQGLCERSPWGIPHTISVDPYHDTAYNANSATTNSLWPFMMGFGAISNPDDAKRIARRFGEVHGQELRMSGVTMLLGPMADIATEPRWARIQHCISSDPDVVAELVAEVIAGMQGSENGLVPGGQACVVKHFPGSGSDEEGMDSHSPHGRYQVFPGNLFEEHLRPFDAAFKVGVAGVMPCYGIFETNNFEQVGSAFTSDIMVDLLRDRFGFNGYIVSDWYIDTHMPWGLEDLTKYELVGRWLKAGTHQHGGNQDVASVMRSYEEGYITVEDIDFAVQSNLKVVFQQGLFENPYVNLAEAQEFWRSNGSAFVDRSIAAEEAQKKAMVLCKNNSSFLPVKPDGEKYDTNGNGVVEIFFDSNISQADSGELQTVARSEEYSGFTFVDNINNADIAIVRMFSRGGEYWSALGGIPLSYDGITYVWDHEAKSYTDIPAPTTSMGIQGGGDTTKNSGGYRTVGGSLDNYQRVFNAIGARDGGDVNGDGTIDGDGTNPTLKIVVGMTASRPGIVAPFLGDVHSLIVDFGATDSSFLDVVFNADGSAPTGNLPVEIPANDESVNAQFEDVPCDTVEPTFKYGFGLRYMSE